MTDSPQAPNTPAPPVVIIERENVLLPKVGGPLNPNLVTKAEQAVSQMAGDFAQWIEQMVDKVVAERQTLGAGPITKATATKLYTTVLETKSLGETYGYPLISRFSHSLCRLLIRLEGPREAPIALVDAHIAAIRAALREKMTTADHPIGLALATELEKQVAELAA